MPRRVATGADLGIALAIASAARGVPTKEGLAAFGEIGLTGRLRRAGQAEWRQEECAKLGIKTVITPAVAGTLPEAVTGALVSA
jgi:DNA repair protein RadA/Sms